MSPRWGIAALVTLSLMSGALCSPARGAVRCGDSASLCAAGGHPAHDLLGVGGGLAGLAGTGTSLVQGLGGFGPTAIMQFALQGLVAWVAGGATFALHETATVLGETTAPSLTSTWFSAAYWKVAGLAAVLTLPFIFAAAIQALMRSDLTLLLRAALGYLPLAMLAVAIAAPLTMLLLSASDELAAAVSSAAGHQSGYFLAQAIVPFSAVSAVFGSPFLLVLLGLFTVAGALILWIELLMREAAVYVIVLMLPLAFAAFVWPARRVWAIRSLEILIALILSKFAIVAVLSLGGLALGHSVNTSLTGLLAGIVLLILGTFTPWALLRLVPLSELASGAAGSLRDEGARGLRQADAWAGEAQHWVSTTAQMARAFAGASTSGRAPDVAALNTLPESSRGSGAGGEEAEAGAGSSQGSPPAPAEPSPDGER